MGELFDGIGPETGELAIQAGGFTSAFLLEVRGAAVERGRRAPELENHHVVSRAGVERLVPPRPLSPGVDVGLRALTVLSPLTAARATWALNAAE